MRELPTSASIAAILSFSSSLVGLKANYIGALLKQRVLVAEKKSISKAMKYPQNQPEARRGIKRKKTRESGPILDRVAQKT